MNRFKYLEVLSTLISNEVPNDEYNDAMQYYTEYFQDAGAEKEDEVIAEIGNPEEVAKKIIAEYKGKTVAEVEAEKNPEKKKGLSTGWMVFIAIIGSPLWITLFCIAISLAIALLAIVVSVGACSVSFLVSGVGMIFFGIVALISSPSVGIFTVGSGFVLLALGILFLVLTVLLCKFVIWLFKIIFTKKRRKA